MDQYDLDENYRSAANNGDLERVKKYLKKGANVNAVSEDNFSAIAAAAYSGYVDVVSYLMQQDGINPEISDKDGSALLNAIVNNRIDCAKVLLAGGCDVNARYPENDRTALMILMYKDYSLEWIELILSYDPDLTLEDEDGNTIFAYAEDREKIALEEYMLSKDPDVISYHKSVGSRVVHDVFDFDKREKTTMIRENKYGKVEAVTCDRFEEVSRSYLRKAFNEHVKRGGKTKAHEIGLSEEMNKSKIKPVLKRRVGG